MYGVLDLSIPEVETPEVVAGRIREALRYVDAERLWIAPDCGMKYHSREHSQAKLKARSEEHTSELQSLMRISYAVFCLKKKKEAQSRDTVQTHTIIHTR